MRLGKFQPNAPRQDIQEVIVGWEKKRGVRKKSSFQHGIGVSLMDKGGTGKNNATSEKNAVEKKESTELDHRRTLRRPSPEEKRNRGTSD